MQYTLVVKEDARLDMLHAYQYYEQEQEGLGDRFLTHLLERFTSLAEHPEYYSYIDSKHILRDVTVEAFPFVIVYEIIAKEVIIYAVCSTYRRPNDKYKRGS